MCALQVIKDMKSAKQLLPSCLKMTSEIEFGCWPPCRRVTNVVAGFFPSNQSRPLLIFDRTTGETSELIQAFETDHGFPFACQSCSSFPRQMWKSATLSHSWSGCTEHSPFSVCHLLGQRKIDQCVWMLHTGPIRAFTYTRSYLKSLKINRCCVSIH